MKNLFTVVSISVLAFVIATSATRAYFNWNIQFQSKGVGSMGMCADGFGRFSSYESYDGERLTFLRVRFPSASSAQECFESSLKADGVRVLNREELLDKTGGTVAGQRVVASKDPDGYNSGLIIRQDEHDMAEIASPSVQHA